MLSEEIAPLAYALQRVAYCHLWERISMGDTVRVKNPAGVLVAISIGAFLATFNETFLNVALTPIMQDFRVTSGDVQWVSTAYMLVTAVVVPITSFLYRSVPTRRLSIIALAFLLAGTLLGSVAQSLPQLIAGRCVQAIGTGMIVPIGMNLTLLVAPQGKLGTYMGIVSAVTLLGPAFGPIAGGLLLTFGSWHMLFAVFAVFCAAALVVNAVFVGNFEALTKPKLDGPSVALISLGLVGIMYAISTVFANPAVALVSFAIGAVSAVAFVRRQKRIPEPLLNLAPFSDRGFVCGVAVVFIAFMAVFAMNILLPLFMQGALGFSALDAALTLLVPCSSCVVFAPVAGRLYDRYGFKYSLPIALAVMSVFLFSMSQVAAAATAIVIALVYLPILAGCNFSIGPAQSFALDRLSNEMHPHGVTVCYAAIQVAGCIGSSFYVGIMNGVEQNMLANGTAQTQAVTAGFSASCAVAAVLALVGFAFAVATARISARKSEAVAGPASSTEYEIDAVMFPNAYTVPSTATAFDALSTMVRYRTNSLPVVDETGALAGIVSDGDVVRALSDETEDKLNMAYIFAEWERNGSLSASLQKLKDVPVLELATRKVVSVDRAEGLDAVARKLSDRNVKKIPVTENGKVVGAITRSNLLRYLVAGERVQELPFEGKGSNAAAASHAA
jgi:DHA2 family lincomycin resistance protein-like MFS transporter